MIEKPKAILKLSKAIVAGSAFPVKLTVGLTYRCQSRCNYCDVWKRYQHKPDGYKIEAQSVVYLKMLEELKNDVLWLEFTGGEPFLRKDIVEIVSFAMNNTGIVAAGLTSNGLDQNLVLGYVHRILTNARKKQLVIGISVDGDSETY